MNASQTVSEVKRWLTQDVLPLWSTTGIDPTNGSFIENLSRDREPLPSTRRVMVQARQIFSFAEAARMGALTKAQVTPLLRKAVDHMISKYSQPDGSFVHAVNPDGSVASQQVDLYGQAFALFALANAYEFLQDVKLKNRGKELLGYLNSERRIPAGGYTEIIGGKTTYAANPHMHLFEAAIAWMKVDEDPAWSTLAANIVKLCRTKFVDSTSGCLCEQFDANWQPLRENGRFAWEPGHHFEWAWLLLQYEDLSGDDLDDLPIGLYEIADQAGVDKRTGLAIDEVWSDLEPKKRSARFWPQTERIKAAVSFGEWASKDNRASFARAADQAMVGLQKYFQGVKPGLWEDTMTEDGKFTDQPVKASSLYHIINAISEYTSKRPSLT